MHKIGIVCAVEKELLPFLPHLENRSESQRARLTIHEGSLFGLPVAAVYSGVCKVNAAIATQILIHVFGVNTLINSGTAGGMAKEIGLFDTVISTEVAYHDVEEGILTEYHPWMTSPFFAASDMLLDAAAAVCRNRPRVHFGRMVTGEQFVENGMHAEINRKFAPLSVDMETGSIAQVCYAYCLPFLSVRTITDTEAQAGVEVFESHCEQAAIISKDIVLEVLRALGTSP
jgi:adenosylhomocysteine nucleosidase